MRDKVPGVHKLDIIDHTSAIRTRPEKEFVELYDKHHSKKGPVWSRILGEYNSTASESYEQGRSDIRWKTVPLLKFAKECESATNVARSFVFLCYRISLM